MEEKRKRLSVPLLLFCILMIVTVLLCGTVAALWLHGRNTVTANVAAPVLPDEEQEGGGTEGESSQEGVLLETYTIRYNGKAYQYNENMCNILLMGIDADTKPSEPLPYGSNIQVDVIVLAALDLASGKMTLINISRDTLCDIEILDDAGSSQGYSKAQLALSYSYGDGLRESCQLCRDAVSNIFYGLQIHGYAGFYLGGIADLNDALGGVTVTILDDYPYYTIWYPRMVAGRELTLQGEEATAYVQSRNETADGNAQRMVRQKQYMLSMITTAKELVKSDPTKVFSVYDAVDDYIITDLDISRITYLATKAAGMEFSGDIQSLQGESVLGKGNHVELTLDQQALYELILDVFYNEVEE